MKKGLFASYFAGIRDVTHGESLETIIRYFLPEFVTALLLYSVPIWVEGSFVSHLQSTPATATLGATNNLIHTFIKMSESIMVGTLVLAGQFNGRGEYKEVGRAVQNAFWVTCLFGLAVSTALYFGAYWIYAWLGVPAEIIGLGVPYLHVRAIGIFFMFMYMALVGFLRGIKNTKVPMQIYIMGACILIVSEYLLMFGNYGFPELGLQGAAFASVIQFFFMTVVVLAYILLSQETRKYAFNLLHVFRSRAHTAELIRLTWPTFLDKTILTMAYIWLLKMIAPMGSCIVASFCVIKDMERVALAPAVAFASVITFLVSNDYGRKNWDSIKSNIKKTVFLGSFCVMGILVIFSMMPEFVIGIFDKKGEFVSMAARAFPILSILAFFDLLQVILSGALRGAANVKTVMMTRLLVCGGIFVPLSYCLTYLPMDDHVLKFIIIYGSFYACNGIMSFIYINRFRSEEWKKQTL